MTWLHQDTPVETLPEECVGFVYLITNNLSGRKYIGKKLAKFSKTTYKIVKQKNDSWLESVGIEPEIVQILEDGFVNEQHIVAACAFFENTMTKF